MDTNACIDFFDGDKNLLNVLNKQTDLISITTITIYEIDIGMEMTKRKKSEERYQNLQRKWIKLTSNLRVLSLGIKEAKKSAEIYDNLKSKGILIDDNDILIAGIMLSNGVTKIITRNLRHFQRIESLEIISY